MSHQNTPDILASEQKVDGYLAKFKQKTGIDFPKIGKGHWRVDDSPTQIRVIAPDMVGFSTYLGELPANENDQGFMSRQMLLLNAPLNNISFGLQDNSILARTEIDRLDEDKFFVHFGYHVKSAPKLSQFVNILKKGCE